MIKWRLFLVNPFPLPFETVSLHGKYNGNMNDDVLVNNSIFTLRQWS